MTTGPMLDRDRVRELFDLRGAYLSLLGGDYREDPYPAWARLRAEAPVHPGVVHELTGFEGDAFFHGLPYPDRPHFSAFSFDACDAIYRDPGVFASSPEPVDPSNGELSVLNSMLALGGTEHRRYRTLVQPSFVPAKAKWWSENWINETVNLLIDSFVDQGSAELNVDFCAAIPVLTITGSFGVPVDQALDIRAALHQPAEVVEIIRPIVEARRASPQDDLISVLVEAEMKDDDGTTHRLNDAEIYSFALLLLSAGSGTTWKQMGLLLGTLLARPEMLEAIKRDRALVRPAIEESVRWTPTDPMFSRWVTEDVELFGVAIPEGAVVHQCIGAANRDPARWERPDDYDLTRPLKPTLGFGGGPHVCLGMHVARAEMAVALNALLDRCPNLRLDPDEEAPSFVGMYERGATAIPVVFG